MLTYRELPEEEFDRLHDHPALNGLEIRPDATRIIVAERADGEIVGFQMVVTVVHLEPIWVHPDYRGKLVAFKLFTLAAKLLDVLRLKVAYIFADRPEVAGYLSRLGMRLLPYKVFLHDPHEIYPPDPQND